MEKWHKRFIELAKTIAQYSKDPNTKVGAVIVDSEKRIVSMGYNGFPRKVLDLDERLNNREEKVTTPRFKEQGFAVHALHSPQAPSEP